MSAKNITDTDFFGKTIIYRTHDSWGDIFVIDRGNIRALNFDPVYDQTGIYIQYPHIPVHEYTRVMLLVLAFVNPSHITLLGLGGGSLIHCLHFLLPECPLFCIELRQKVYDVATNFFQLPESQNIEILIADAQVAIKFQKSNNTQVIFADMYLDYGMDSFQIQQQFIEQAYRVLDDTGWLVINFHELPELNSPFILSMRDYFAELFICPTVSDNYILFASKCSVAELHSERYQTILTELENKLNIKLLRLFKKIKNYKSE
ncbi:spermine synthase [Fluoribacter gormanii]|uniref:spermine synthase n=1 Tax=Fluoribacter gormanii TaxID=464 RepID=UPI002244D43F|nr:spermine synthase [Fluoribacter gormanii]MCW8445538.1 spermine synthase [Fluoribacter gormanii]MCW8470788.1 spermine synthase [Fluoribacter gormanii]